MMKKSRLIFPIILLVAGIGSLAILGEPYGFVSFAAALMCATISYLYTGRRSAESATGFKVSLKEITFIHYERSRADRPKTTDEVTNIFDQANQKMRNKEYPEAATLFSRAFHLGNQYWAAKVNEGFCFQAIGDFDQALAIYSQIERECPTPKFRRQALGNSGEILFAMAGAVTSREQKESLTNEGYGKYEAAHAAEETFVSLYNLWQAASITKRAEQEADLLAQLQTHPEFQQLEAQKMETEPPPRIGGHGNEN